MNKANASAPAVDPGGAPERMPVVRIDEAALATLIGLAESSPRRRRNRNFHSADDAVAHRLLNAILPGSYIQPHCHADPDKDESIVILRGRLGVVVFESDGEVRETLVLDPSAACVGIDIPHGVFHTLVALDGPCVVFEAKAGPFVPLAAGERGAWAPAEGEAGAAGYLAELRRRFD